MSFNKIFLLTFSFLALITFFSSTIKEVHAIDLPHVYVEELTHDLSKDIYKPGEEITGSFVLRNADVVDVTNIHYAVAIVKVISEENEQRSFDYLDRQEFGPINIAAQNKTGKIDFKINVPQNATGEDHEVRIEALSSSKIKLSWNETEKFSVENSNALISVVDAYVKLDNEVTHTLNYGPTIYSDQSPKTVALYATLSSQNATKVFPEISITKWPNKEEIFSINANALDVSGKANFIFDLPTFDYAPGVYAGKVQFKDSNGNNLSPDLVFRYVINGNIVTIHSLSSSSQNAGKGENFTVTAFITGNPVDLDQGGPTEEKNDSLDQNVSIFLEVTDTKNKLVASAEKTADLSQENEFKFDLVAQRSFDFLKGKVTVKKGDQILAEYETPLSANPSKTKNYTFIFIVILIGLLIVGLIAWIISKKTNRSEPVIAALVLLFSVAVSFSLIGADKINANHATPVLSFTYDLIQSRHLQFNPLSNPTVPTSNVALTEGQVNSSPIRVSSPAIDARIPAGSTFAIRGDTTNQWCDNSNDNYFIKIYPESESWIAPAANAWGTPVGSIMAVTGLHLYSAHVYEFNKTAIAPALPGVYKLWVGSQRVSYWSNPAWAGKPPFSRYYVVGYQTYTVVPTTPANFTVTPNGCNGVINLAWDASTGATEYRIFRSEDGGTTFSTSPIATIPVPGLTHTDNVDIADSTKNYVYRIVAVHAPTGIVSDPAEKALVKPANCPTGVSCGAYSDVARTQQETQFDIGNTVYFKASVTGGSGNNTYTWTGVSSSNGALAENQYSAEGRYPTNVTVTDTNQASLTDSCVIDVYVGGICDANKDCRRNNTCTNGRCRPNGGDPNGDPDTISCAIEGNPNLPTGTGTHDFKWNLNITNGKSPFTVTWNIPGTTPATETNTTNNRQDSVTRTVDTSIVATYRPTISVVDGNGRSIDMSKYPECPVATTQCIPPISSINDLTLTPRIVPIGGQCKLGFKADNILSCRVHDVVRNQTVTGLSFTTSNGALGSIIKSDLNVRPGIYTVICDSPAVCGQQQSTIQANSHVECLENINIKED